jgi:hypothetical protein
VKSNKHSTFAGLRTNCSFGSEAEHSEQRQIDQLDPVSFHQSGRATVQRFHGSSGQFDRIASHSSENDGSNESGTNATGANFDAMESNATRRKDSAATASSAATVERAKRTNDSESIASATDSSASRIVDTAERVRIAAADDGSVRRWRM